MKQALLIFAFIVTGFSTLMASGNPDAIQSYIEAHHPAAKHVQMHETGEGIVMVLFTDHDMRYKIGFDQSNRPVCSEVEISTQELPLSVQSQIPAGVQTRYLAYNSTATKHFYTIQYTQGNQQIKRFFNENGTELKH